MDYGTFFQMAVRRTKRRMNHNSSYLIFYQHNLKFPHSLNNFEIDKFHVFNVLITNVLDFCC